jgi:hypothetical protein
MAKKSSKKGKGGKGSSSKGSTSNSTKKRKAPAKKSALAGAKRAAMLGMGSALKERRGRAIPRAIPRAKHALEKLISLEPNDMNSLFLSNGKNRLRDKCTRIAHRMTKAEKRDRGMPVKKRALNPYMEFAANYRAANPRPSTMPLIEYTKRMGEAYHKSRGPAGERLPGL